MLEALIVPPPEWVPTPLRYMYLRRRTGRLLRHIGVDPAKGVSAAIDALSARLGLPITVEPYDFPMPGFFSATLCDAEGIEFYYHSATSPEHQAHSLIHEWAHVVLGTTEPGTAGITASTHRTGNYSNIVERDAEYVARLYTAMVGLDAASRLPAQNTEGSRRLARAFEDQITWA
ncbi:hypothetical protein ACWELJ_21350 [Nocardia sp. NPDC004582]